MARNLSVSGLIISGAVCPLRLWQNQLLQHFRRDGLIRRAAALLALLGFVFGVVTPALALVSQSGPGLRVGGPLGVYVCHVQDGVRAIAVPGQSAPADDEHCCLVCSAAQLAQGALAPQALVVVAQAPPVRGLDTENRAGIMARVFHPLQARAPPRA